MNFSKFTVKELKAELARRNIIMDKANKKTLLERLQNEHMRDQLVLQSLSHSQDDILEYGSQDLKDDPEITDEEGAAGIEDDNNVHIDRTVIKNSIFTFKDVEESLQKFTGEKNQNIRKWLKDFEDASEVIKWSSIQKFVYAKRLLTGAAKSFIYVEQHVRTFDQLKVCLIDEFGKKINGALVHKELRDTKMKQSETYREYLYRMMAIAEQADVDLESTIQYVIDGIEDSEANKAILYGPSTLVEIKKRLDYYEVMKSKSRLDCMESVEKSISTLSMDPKISSKKNRCYKCGGVNHEFKTCQNDVKCFKCQKSGHISTSCPEAVILKVSSESDDCQEGRV